MTSSNDKNMNSDINIEKYQELCLPFEKAILLCDSHQELLMLGCIMMTQVKDIFDTYLGVEGRNLMFKGVIDA